MAESKEQSNARIAKEERNALLETHSDNSDNSDYDDMPSLEKLSVNVIKTAKANAAAKATLSKPSYSSSYFDKIREKYRTDPLRKLRDNYLGATMSYTDTADFQIIETYIQARASVEDIIEKYNELNTNTVVTKNNICILAALYNHIDFVRYCMDHEEEYINNRKEIAFLIAMNNELNFLKELESRGYPVETQRVFQGAAVGSSKECFLYIYEKNNNFVETYIIEILLGKGDFELLKIAIRNKPVLSTNDLNEGINSLISRSKINIDLKPLNTEGKYKKCLRLMKEKYPDFWNSTLLVKICHHNNLDLLTYVIEDLKFDKYIKIMYFILKNDYIKDPESYDGKCQNECTAYLKSKALENLERLTELFKNTLDEEDKKDDDEDERKKRLSDYKSKMKSKGRKGTSRGTMSGGGGNKSFIYESIILGSIVLISSLLQ